MQPADALRFLDHEARQCRDRDAHEALCLLLPTLLRVLRLTPMDSFEALDFRCQLREKLKQEMQLR
jgi:hypothetical protein